MKSLLLRITMKHNQHTNIVIIDGQGGKLGRQLIESIKGIYTDAHITAIGTNTIATANMLKGGADIGATGENAVVVNCRTADIIIGPIGIVIADSLFGEITPKMAEAVGQSLAQRILIPINKCGNIIVGIPDFAFSKLIELTMESIKEVLPLP
jgi:hypothetical protein